MRKQLVTPLMLLVTSLTTCPMARGQEASTQAATRINDPVKAFSRIEFERIAFAIQDLEQAAKIEARVQAVEKPDDIIPRPVTARDVSILLNPKTGEFSVNVGTEIKRVLPDERVQTLIAEAVTPSMKEKAYGDAVVNFLNKLVKIGAEESGVKESRRLETGRDLMKVIAICSAATLLFLWIILFMNNFVGEKVSTQPYLFRIFAAHIVTIIGMLVGYALELKFGLGIVGMGLIPLIFAIQMLILYRVFAKLLPAITRA